MMLSRIDAVCWPLQLDFAELARRVADIRLLVTGLTGTQRNTAETEKKAVAGNALCAVARDHGANRF